MGWGLCSATQAMPAMHLGWVLGVSVLALLCCVVQRRLGLQCAWVGCWGLVFWLVVLCSATQAAPAMHLGWVLGVSVLACCVV